MAEEYTRPGWYPDPQGSGERWWNGASWSDTRRGAAAAPPPPAARPDPYARPTTVVPSGATVDLSQNRFALLAIILGFVGLFASITGPAAIVLGLLGIRQARRLAAGGRPLSSIAIAAIGVVLGAIATVILITSIVAVIAAITVSYTP
ncbi:MAG: hypothetical protein BGO97_13705 [Micrococcales bacterium 70-64]|nr:DUF2510 domain-containing protein [Leifsonia sp.]ODU64985.1 MAG: hypothetical protein ABT06_13705 [Leifsonia sp. SCN 70-46]OJX86677.1 MAG: hypothetical protein BGO97_13705 [Micrococcales bacterium 70-64]